MHTEKKLTQMFIFPNVQKTHAILSQPSKIIRNENTREQCLYFLPIIK